MKHFEKFTSWLDLPQAICFQVRDMIVTRLALVCGDGTILSIQASCGHFSEPKETLHSTTLYEGFEVSAFNKDLDIIGMKAGETNAAVPAELIQQEIDTHKGIIGLMPDITSDPFYICGDIDFSGLGVLTGTPPTEMETIPFYKEEDGKVFMGSVHSTGLSTRLTIIGDEAHMSDAIAYMKGNAMDVGEISEVISLGKVI